MSDTCRGANTPHMILACSGGSNVGQLTNQAAVELTREGFGKMFCLAGLGGNIPGLVKAARAAGGLVALDGCAVGCARAILDRAGLPVAAHVVVTDLGIEKVKDRQLAMAPEGVERVAESVRQAVRQAAANPREVTAGGKGLDREQVERRAEELMRGGLHCAEAVLAAVLEGRGLGGAGFAPRAASAFGGGVGRGKQEICGALSGGLVALGLVLGRDSGDATWDAVAATAASVRGQFEAAQGCTACGEVLERLGPQEGMDKCIRLAGATAGLFHAALEAPAGADEAAACGCTARAATKAPAGQAAKASGCGCGCG